MGGVFPLNKSILPLQISHMNTHIIGSPPTTINISIAYITLGFFSKYTHGGLGDFIENYPTVTAAMYDVKCAE